MKVVAKNIPLQLILLILILATGSFLRLYNLDGIPKGFTGDEGWLGLDALNILQTGWVGVYIPSHAWGYNALHAYLAAPFVKLLGENVFAVRLSTTVLSIAGLVSFYFLSRQFYSVQVSLITLLLLSLSYWHLNFSRVAFPGIILIPLFSCLSFLSILLAIKSDKKIYFLLLGIFLALGVYSYHYFNFTLIAVFIYLSALSLRYRASITTGKFTLTFLVLFALLIPYFLYIITNPVVFISKWQHVSPFVQTDKIQSQNNLVLLDNTYKTILMFFTSGDLDQLDNLKEVTVLNIIQTIFFVLGLFLALANIRNFKNLLLIIWLLSGLVVGILTADAPNSKRIIDTIPPIFLLTGLAISFLQSKLDRRLFFVIILITILFTAFNTYEIYFKKYADSPTVASRFANEVVQFCNYSQQYNLGYVYFYHHYTTFNYETRRFLCPDLIGEDRSYEFSNFSIELTKNPASFVFFEGYQDTLIAVRNKYPNGQLKIKTSQNGDFIFAVYTINI